MNKSDLIEVVAASAGLTQPSARIMIGRLVKLVQTAYLSKASSPLPALGRLPSAKVRRGPPVIRQRGQAEGQTNRYCRSPCHAGLESRRKHMSRLSTAKKGNFHSNDTTLL